MVGHVAMEITEAEMIAAMQFYLNQSVFNATADGMRKYHYARVSSVRQRGNNHFVIEFDGLPEPEAKAED